MVCVAEGIYEQKREGTMSVHGVLDQRLREMWDEQTVYISTE